MECRVSLTTWPRAKPAPPQSPSSSAGGGQGGRSSARAARLREPAAAAAEQLAGAAAAAPPRPQAFRAACLIPLPKKHAQALDLKIFLHQEFGVAYTDMVLQYRGVGVMDMEVISALPDWSNTPVLELLVLPGSHTDALHVARTHPHRELGWAQLYAHVTQNAHHEDWVGRQAAAEAELRRANGLLPHEPGEAAGLEAAMRAEHRLDALLCAFGAAAASIVRVVGQYPCPLQPTHSQELSERYGPGLKYVANGIVVRRVTTGLAIAQSAEVCAAVTSAPKVAAAHQRACNAARGRIDSLCVPLSTVVEFLGVRWEATAVVPCGELGYGTYTGGRSEPLRQLEQAAPVVAALAEAFGHADAEGGGADGVEEAVAEGPLPRSTRLFLVDDMPGPIPASSLYTLSLPHPFFF